MLALVEHFTRSRIAQIGAPVGALLGTAGMNIEVHTSFELTLRDGALDTGLFAARLEQFRQVFPDWTLVGCYTVGEPDSPFLEACAAHAPDHAVQLVLDVSTQAFAAAQRTGMLPLTVYKQTNTGLSPCPHTLDIDDAERVALGDLTRLARAPTDQGYTSDADEYTRAIAAAESQRNAIELLCDRLGAALSYIDGVQRGTFPHDDATMRLLAGALANYQTTNPPEFDAARERHAVDAQLTQYCASLTDSMHLASELMELGQFAASSRSVRRAAHRGLI